MSREIYFNDNFKAVKIKAKDGREYYGLHAVNEGFLYYGKAYKVSVKDVESIKSAQSYESYVKSILKNHILINRIVDLQNKYLVNFDENRLKQTKVNPRQVKIQLILEGLKENGFDNFIHMTHVDNLVEILKCGYLKSRMASEETRVYDNIENNEITNAVMKTNKSKKVEEYVRFYLRPINAALYSMFSNNSKHVVLLFDDSLVLENDNKFKPIFLIGNAHYLHEGDLNKNSIFSTQLLDNFLSKKSEFHRIFTNLLDQEHKAQDKNYMQSELLINGEVPIKYIRKIVFPYESYKNEFVDKLKKSDIDNINDILSMTIVDINYFWN